MSLNLSVSLSSLHIIAAAFVIVLHVAAGQECVPNSDTKFACDFSDDFSFYDTSRWWKAQGWYSGSPFGSYVYAPNVQHESGNLKLIVDERSATFSGQVVPYSGAQYQTRVYYGYGCFEVRVKPPKVSGMVSSFFLYSDRFNTAPGSESYHNEIDIEFIYKTSTQSMAMQANYYTHGTGGNEYTYHPSFAMESSFNWYGFKWTSSGIEWYVNGVKVHTATTNTPQFEDGPLKLMLNTWTILPTSTGGVIWAGAYTHTGPQEALYDEMCHTAGESCSMSSCGTQGVVGGDPHFVGFNGVRFDFHGRDDTRYVVFAHRPGGDVLTAKTRATIELTRDGRNKTYFTEFGLQPDGSRDRIRVHLDKKETGRSWGIFVTRNGQLLQGNTSSAFANVTLIDEKQTVLVHSEKHVFFFRAVSVTSRFRKHIDFKVSLKRDPDVSDMYTGVLGITLSQRLGFNSTQGAHAKTNQAEFEETMHRKFAVKTIFPNTTRSYA